jgi:hypothetical protein
MYNFVWYLPDDLEEDGVARNPLQAAAGGGTKKGFEEVAADEAQVAHAGHGVEMKHGHSQHSQPPAYGDSDNLF